MRDDRQVLEHDSAARSNGNGPQGQELSVAVAVPNEMVRIFKESFGRGPTRARADWAGPDALVCTLEDSLMPAERRLVELGDQQRVREVRTLLEHASEAQLREAVERITRRKVRAFTSGTDPDQDVSSKVFYFEAEED
jgi:uncharacterized protein YbcI